MLTGPQVILTLKVAVAAVTCVLAASLVALLRGNYRLHGWLNTVFLVLTLAALGGLELLIRLVEPHIFDYFDLAQRRALWTHLSFSLPAAVLLPIMWLTGRAHRDRWHVGLSVVFGALWLGTFITGIFLL